MKRFAILVGVILAAIGVDRWGASATIRYKLTLSGDVDGKLFAGSVVNEVTYSSGTALLPNEAQFQISVIGQALEVEVGDRGKLFALLRQGKDVRTQAEYIVLRAFNPADGSFPYPVSKGLNTIRSLSGKADLTMLGLPMLVRFRDPKDPMTVEEVTAERLDQYFGPGARLKAATLELVPSGYWPFNRVGLSGYPLTKTIRQTLPWLAQLNAVGGYLGGGATDKGSPLGLARDDFVRGD